MIDGATSNGQRPELHLSLVIPGAIAVGAFEAGVLAVLINAIRASHAENASGPRLFIDVIAGASAGSMTAALVAYILLTGADVTLLKKAWVEEIDIVPLLAGDHADTALSNAIVRKIAETCISDPARRNIGTDVYRQKTPIRLVFALTNLTGRNETIHVTSGAPDIPIASYADWIQFRVACHDSVPWDDTHWERVRMSAMASGAVPVAFEPIVIARDGKDFVYVDGGVLDNRPLGYAIDATFNPGDLGPPEFDEYTDVEQDVPDEQRHFVLIETGAESITEHREPGYFRPWRIGIDSLITAPRNQSIAVDLHRLVKVNGQIDWLNRAVEKLKTIGPDDTTRAITAVLQSECAKILAEKADMKPTWKSGAQYGPENVPAVADASTSFVDTLRLFATLVGGMRAKKPISLSIIQPADDASEDERVLSGGLLGHFGGFLYQPLRENDYALGCSRTVEWLRMCAGVVGAGLYAQAASLVAVAQPAKPDPALVNAALEKLPVKARESAIGAALSAALALGANHAMGDKRPRGLFKAIWAGRGLVEAAAYTGLAVWLLAAAGIALVVLFAIVWLIVTFVHR